MADSQWITLRLPSRLEMVDAAHDEAERLARSAGFDDNRALGMALAVREAVVNAMAHGHGYDEEREVVCRLRAEEGRMEARIRDEGEGFDPDSVPDPGEEDGLLKDSGRGVAMIRGLVDEASWRFEDGTELILVIRDRPGSRPDRRAEQKERT